jgi:hypothetical protein
MSASHRLQTPAPAEPPDGSGSPMRFLKWHKRILGFCFAVFAIELGLFLLIFPWLNSWDLNWVPLQSPRLRALWLSPYLRGALSGLGLVNLYVGFAELLGHLRSLFK